MVWNQRNYDRLRYQRLKKAGLCGHCAIRPVAKKGSSRCQECKAKNASDDRRRYCQRTKRLKEMGFCEECGLRPPIQDMTRCEECRQAQHERSHRHQRKLRDETFLAYGGPICACCGEDEIEFLQLDHINNDGTKHRLQVNGRRTGTVYRWLKKHGFPPGFQVLCANCNWAKRKDGQCPHQRQHVGVGPNDVIADLTLS